MIEENQALEKLKVFDDIKKQGNNRNSKLLGRIS